MATSRARIHPSPWCGAAALAAQSLSGRGGLSWPASRACCGGTQHPANTTAAPENCQSVRWAGPGYRTSMRHVHVSKVARGSANPPRVERRCEGWGGYPAQVTAPTAKLSVADWTHCNRKSAGRAFDCARPAIARSFDRGLI